METYLDYKKNQDIHGTILYPAPMIAPLQFDVLKKLAVQDNLKILDPFHGSGVSLYEASKLNSSFEIHGFDINPFANLITKAKLHGVDMNIFDDIKNIKNNIYNKYFEYTIHEFSNIKKWFKKEIIISLSKIRAAIMMVNSRQNRIFLWAIFSNVVRKYSNTRSSTYKLHQKTDDQIENIKDNVLNYFLKLVEESIGYYINREKNNIYLKKADSLNEMSKYMDDFFDIIITSPPYGDNRTTVPYGQFSTLPIFWIDEKDLELEGWELDNYSIIDNNSMGGKLLNNLAFDEIQFQLLNVYTSRISNPKKILKVQNFMYDYFVFLDQIKRLSSRYLILTLGNRTVDKIKIDLTKITKVYLENFGFKCNSVIVREMKNKRIPKMTSNVNNEKVSSINKEYLLILEKIKK